MRELTKRGLSFIFCFIFLKVKKFPERFFQMNKFVYRTIENAIDAGIDICTDLNTKVKQAGKWIAENPQTTVSIISSVAMLLRASQSIVVSQRVYSERRHADRTYYDRSSGHRWSLRRKLTNRDKALIEQRKHRGDNVYDILSDIGAI